MYTLLTLNVKVLNTSITIPHNALLLSFTTHDRQFCTAVCHNSGALMPIAGD